MEPITTFYGWLTGDPVGISVFSFIRNVIYLTVVIVIFEHIMLRMFDILNRGMKIDDTRVLWEELKKGNVAIGIYLGLRVFGVLYVLGNIAGSFLK